MTRIFGFERHSENAHIPQAAQTVFDNLQEAVIKTYERGWQAYGLGFIIVEPRKAQGISVYKGYQGIKVRDSIQDLLPNQLHKSLANNPLALFGVLQNSPDKGEKGFEEDRGREFPLVSENWLVITMGWWGNNGFSDEKLPWYNQDRPSLSIPQYLETKPEKINFDWIDPKRTPLVIAAKRDGSQICVVDNYTGKNEKGFSYITSDYKGITMYQGVRDTNGTQV